jgi:shikimate dehydrogenase
MRNMYFIGVSTGQSAINTIFPEWCRLAKCGECSLIGIDLPVDAEPRRYREAVTRICDDPNSCGALVTTHKLAVVAHAGDLFTEWTEDARQLGEVSCIVRRAGKLAAHALDVDCSAFALNRILPASSMSGREVVILGAGGAGKAITTHLQRTFPNVRITITDVRPDRLHGIDNAKTIVAHDPEVNDSVVQNAAEGSIVINATGLGKDLPGSPLTSRARFPNDAIAWELNYRGDLQFLKLARQQGIRMVDGWDYFVRGWSTTMSLVLDFELTPELFESFSAAAQPIRPPLF